MRILFDACVPRRLRRYLPGHTIITAREMGWNNFPDGPLLTAIGREFDVLVTVDRSLRHQQRVGSHAFAILIL
ncbi:MAG: hypothetical protein ACT4N2_06545 [Hyphomicrobium sp.]